MSKNWQKAFSEIDGAKFQVATAALVAPLETLQANLAEAQAEQEGLAARAPEVLANDEEASLYGGPEAVAARQALLDLQAALENCDRRISVILDTLNRERSSPKLEALAAQLWDTAAGFRSALVELAPDAWQELEAAQKSYLVVVAKIGGLGRKISRVEEIMISGARPFMAEKPHLAPTPLPAIVMDPHIIQAAYDPDAKPAITGPAALHQPQPTADSVLQVLKGESE
ncbi:MAG: hypothetical protein Q8M54_00445 [Desulfobaccales bacterium]|nr:hypothetical protein [Desulfobaccales bacterium]